MYSAICSACTLEAYAYPGLWPSTVEANHRKRDHGQPVVAEDPAHEDRRAGCRPDFPAHLYRHTRRSASLASGHPVLPDRLHRQCDSVIQWVRTWQASPTLPIWQCRSAPSARVKARVVTLRALVNAVACAWVKTGGWKVS